MFFSIVHFRISCFGKPFSTNFTGGWGRGERSSRGWVSCWPFLLCENSPHRFAYLYLIGDKWQFSTQDVWLITLRTISIDLTGAWLNLAVEPTLSAQCEGARQGDKKQLQIQLWYYLCLFRFAASYTSKETANEEEPVVDLTFVPSVEAHRLRDGNLHPIEVYSWG